MRWALPSLIGVMAYLALGCGASAPPEAKTGPAVFKQSCQACHSLSGNESARKPGGDLAGYRLSVDQLLQFASEMPVRRPLSQSQLLAVSTYVAMVERAHDSARSR